MSVYIEYSEPIDKDFHETVKRFSQNTLTFENHCTIERYSDDKNFDLFYFYNIIIDKYIKRIRDKSRLHLLDRETSLRYNYNPFLASHDLCNSPNYWWIMLIANNKLSIHEFFDLGTSIMVPDVMDLKNIIKIEISKNKDFGKVIV